MVSQGFFSFRDNFGEQMSDRFAGEGEKVARVDGPSTPIGSEYGLGSLNINRGATFPVNIRPKKGYTLDDVYGIKKSFVSPRGNEVGQIASSDLTNLRVGSPEVRLASVKSYTDSVTKPYAPDTLDRIIQDTKFPKPYTDTSGNIYDKDPYKSLLSDDNTPNDAKFLGRVGDDLNFSQPYNKRLGEDNFRKEQAGYLRSQGYDENTITRLSGDVPRTMGERTENFFKGLFPGFRDTSEALTRFDIREMNPYQKEYYDKEYKDYRKDMRDKVFSESSYGEDVERGTIGKPGYYYKDFQQPGVYRSQEDVKSYIKDRGAFMTGMPSNFEGGISGKGEKSDDLSSMYRSTAGDEKTRLEKAKEEQENRNILQRVGDFLGGAFNAVTGTQAARGDVLDGRINFNDSVPNISTFSETGDPSFRSYRMGEDFSNLIRGVGDLPAQDTSFSSYVRGAQPGQERGNTRLQEARKIARRNPNVSINEKTGRAVATNDSGRARAQAMAVNRKLSGKSISQKKAENKASMKAKAAARHKAFKKKRAEKKKKKKN